MQKRTNRNKPFIDFAIAYFSLIIPFESLDLAIKGHMINKFGYTDVCQQTCFRNGFGDWARRQFPDHHTLTIHLCIFRTNRSFPDQAGRCVVKCFSDFITDTFQSNNIFTWFNNYFPHRQMIRKLGATWMFLGNFTLVLDMLFRLIDSVNHFRFSFKQRELIRIDIGDKAFALASVDQFFELSQLLAKKTFFLALALDFRA